MSESAEPITRKPATQSDRVQKAAVAFADIVGYSILMATEGELTHSRWMTLLHGTLRPLARKHGSRVVRSTGDGIVAAFPPAVDAFAWAQAVQHAVRASDKPTLPPIAFRISIGW